MPSVPEYLDIDPTIAVDKLRDRVPMPIRRYKDLDASYHDYCFSIAGLTRAHLLEDIHWLLINAEERGEGLDTFTQQFKRLIGRQGWRPGDRRIQIIFDQNIRKAENDGKRSQSDLIPIDTLEFALWRWKDSPKPRENHRALHNKAFPRDGEFYKKVFMPCGFGCRCSWHPVSRDFVIRNSIEVVRNPPPIESIVDPGFRRSGISDRSSMIAEGLSRLSPSLRSQVETSLEKYRK
jgi:hypothetical protein